MPRYAIYAACIKFGEDPEERGDPNNYEEWKTTEYDYDDNLTLSEAIDFMRSNRSDSCDIQPSDSHIQEGTWFSTCNDDIMRPEWYEDTDSVTFSFHMKGVSVSSKKRIFKLLTK